MEDKKKKMGVFFKLHNADIIEYSEKNFSEYGFKATDVKKGPCEIGFNIKGSPKKGLISIFLMAKFYLKQNKKNYELFTIETVHKFKIKNFSATFKPNKKGKMLYNMPDMFVKHILGIAIGGTRGMLIASNKNPRYKNIILPLLDISKLLDSYKRKIT